MRLAALLCTLAAALAAGCGGDDGSSPTPTLPAQESRDRASTRERDRAGRDGRERRERDAGADAGDAAGSDAGKPRGEGSGGEQTSPREKARQRREAGGDDAASGGGEQAPSRGRGRAEREVALARAAVRDLVDDAARGDATVCTRVMTQRYVERVTGLRGAAALRKCRRDIGGNRADAELEVFGPADIKDDRCIVRARVRIGDRHFPHVYDVRRGRDGRWRVDNRLS